MRKAKIGQLDMHVVVGRVQEDVFRLWFHVWGKRGGGEYVLSVRRSVGRTIYTYHMKLTYLQVTVDDSLPVGVGDRGEHPPDELSRVGLVVVRLCVCVFHVVHGVHGERVSWLLWLVALVGWLVYMCSVYIGRGLCVFAFVVFICAQIGHTNAPTHLLDDAVKQLPARAELLMCVFRFRCVCISLYIYINDSIYICVCKYVYSDA